MANRKLGRTPWVRYAGMGFDFFAALAVFGLIGYAIESYYGCAPWGVLTGVILGSIGGLYNLIRQGLKMTRNAVKTDDEYRAEKEREGRSD